MRERTALTRGRWAQTLAFACAETLEQRCLLSRPVVLSSMFDPDTSPHKLIAQFDQDVSASLTAGDLRVEPVTSTDQAPLTTALDYDAGTNTATFSFTGVLPEANYRAVLAEEDVSNAGGEMLSADHVLDFWFLLADIGKDDGSGGTAAGPDRVVNLKDWNRFAAHPQGTPGTYNQGDFNYDGLVNMADYNILAGKFGSTMPAPPPGPA